MTRLFTRLKCDEKGITTIEYGFILALVVLGLLVTLSQMRVWVSSSFNDIEASFPQENNFL